MRYFIFSLILFSLPVFSSTLLIASKTAKIAPTTRWEKTQKGVEWQWPDKIFFNDFGR